MENSKKIIENLNKEEESQSENETRAKYRLIVKRKNTNKNKKSKNINNANKDENNKVVNKFKNIHALRKNNENINDIKNFTLKKINENIINNSLNNININKTNIITNSKTTNDKIDILKLKDNKNNILNLKKYNLNKWNTNKSNNNKIKNNIENKNIKLKYQNKAHKLSKNNSSLLKAKNYKKNDELNFFNSKLTISAKKEEKNNSNKKEKQINFNKNNYSKILIKVNEKPSTNRNNLSSINFYQKNSKNDINKISKIIINKDKINVRKNFSTINNEDLHLSNKKKELKKGQSLNLIPITKNENINTLNITIKNIESKNIDSKIENERMKLIYKNKSAKNFSNFTYCRKCVIYNKKNIISKKPENEEEKSNINNKNIECKDYVIKINLKQKKVEKIRNKSLSIDKSSSDINNIFINDNNNNSLDNINNTKNEKRIWRKYIKLKKDKKKNNNKPFILNRSDAFINSSTSQFSINDTNFSYCINSINIIDSIKDINISTNDLYSILIYEEKLKDIYNIETKNEIVYLSKYCYELINYFRNNSINIIFKNIFINIIDIRNINIINNYTIFSIIIIFELSFYEKIYSNVEILVKDILKLLYSNLILLFKYSNKKYIEDLELRKIIKNILGKYINDKDLFIDDNDYILINQEQDAISSFKEKINYNINIIIRNLCSIINKMKEISGFDDVLNISKMIKNLSLDLIFDFFFSEIMNINNPSLLILHDKIKNKLNSLKTPYITIPNTKKYSLILSLDETIIHLKINNLINHKGSIQLRPGFNTFFKRIKPYYEIIIFSSRDKKYTDIILDSIDCNNSLIDHRLYKEHCTLYNNDLIKDISNIGRPLDKVIIIDNEEQNYRLQKENGINIKSFYGNNINDDILFQLSEILINISKSEDDARNMIKKYKKDILFKVVSNLYKNYCI